MADEGDEGGGGGGGSTGRHEPGGRYSRAGHRERRWAWSPETRMVLKTTAFRPIGEGEHRELRAKEVLGRAMRLHMSLADRYAEAVQQVIAQAQETGEPPKDLERLVDEAVGHYDAAARHAGYLLPYEEYRLGTIKPSPVAEEAAQDGEYLDPVTLELAREIRRGDVGKALAEIRARHAAEPEVEEAQVVAKTPRKAPPPPEK